MRMDDALFRIFLIRNFIIRFGSACRALLTQLLTQAMQPIHSFREFFVVKSPVSDEIIPVGQSSEHIPHREQFLDIKTGTNGLIIEWATNKVITILTLTSYTELKPQFLLLKT